MDTATMSAVAYTVASARAAADTAVTVSASVAVFRPAAVLTAALGVEARRAVRKKASTPATSAAAAAAAVERRPFPGERAPGTSGGGRSSSALWWSTRATNASRARRASACRFEQSASAVLKRRGDGGEPRAPHWRSTGPSLLRLERWRRRPPRGCHGRAPAEGGRLRRPPSPCARLEWR